MALRVVIEGSHFAELIPQTFCTDAAEYSPAQMSTGECT